MLLREFDIHYGGNVLTDKNERTEIGLQTRCVTALFEKCFTARFVTSKHWKISVEAVEEVTKPEPRIGEVIVVQVPFDSNRFFGSNYVTKKRIALETLFTGVGIVARKMNWGMKPFGDAIQMRCRQKLYERMGPWEGKNKP